jgi:hypothetical protein
MIGEFTICPHCQVNNQPGRSKCWSCNSSLPQRIGLDFQPVGVEQVRRDQSLDEYLDRAITVDVAGESRRRTGAPSDDPMKDSDSATRRDHPTLRQGIERLRHLMHR